MNLIPLPLLILDSVVLLFILLFGLMLLITRIRLGRAMREAIESWNLYRIELQPGIAPFLLGIFIATLEKRSLSSGVNLLRIFGLEDGLLKKLGTAGSRRWGKTPAPGDVRRLLTFAPDRALFPVFLLAQRKKRIRGIFEQWLDSAGELFVLRRLALGADGARFDGDEASGFFYSRLGEVRALAGDPDYRARLFGLQIIVTLEDDESRRLSFEALSDGHPEVRRMAAELYRETSPELREKLLQLVCEDPSPAVRDQAALRLFATFPDAEFPPPGDLDNLRALRVAEQLHPDRKEDQDLGLQLFKRDDPELSLVLSRFLDRSGAFARLFATADPGDREGMNRAENILAKGSHYHCRSYLGMLEQEELVHPGPLLIASRILLQEGEERYITLLLKRLISLPDPVSCRKDIREALLNVAEAAAARGNEEARMILGSTMVSRYRDKELQERILHHIDTGRIELLLPPLFDLLGKSDYPEPEMLIELFANIDPRHTIHALIDLIRRRSGAALDGRKRAIRILLRQGNQTGIQHILEELPILEMEEARECAQWLEQFFPAGLKGRISRILSGRDAILRARIMVVIPPSLAEEFRKEMEEALEDPEPEVRIAALHVLHDRFGETAGLMKQLHDPVPGVRKEAARLAAASGKGFAELKKLILDPNEVEPVKEAALAGLGEGDSKEAAQLILDLLGKELELADQVIRTAGTLSNPEAYRLFADRITTATEPLRERIIQAMVEGGPRARNALLPLLQEPEPLRTGAAEALEAVGVVNEAMRGIHARRVEDRLEAVELLTSIGTVKALRGVVLLLKDPSERIRTRCAEAVQQMKDPRGEVLLEQLMEDPMPRVRRYARWAREHLLAESLNQE